MPTPIPIRPVTATVQSGTSTTFVSRAIRPPDVMPRPTSAIPIGSPAATTDPKAMSSTIAAPRRPSASGLDSSWAT
jgi:hypothetical protein